MNAPAHLSALERQAIAAFVSRARESFGERITSIKLFGSRARGTGRSDSDLDIFVSLQNASRADKQQVFDLAFDVGFENGLTISPLIADTAKWSNDMPLARAIQHDGVIL